MKKIKDSISQKGKFTDKLFRLGLKCGITYFGDGFKKPSVIKRALNYPVYSFVDKIIFSKIRKIFGKNFKFFIGGGAMLEIKQQQFFNCIGSPVMQG
jgi:long-chain acyl-CoA synthetase